MEIIFIEKRQKWETKGKKIREDVKNRKKADKHSGKRGSKKKMKQNLFGRMINKPENDRPEGYAYPDLKTGIATVEVNELIECMCAVV